MANHSRWRRLAYDAGTILGLVMILAGVAGVIWWAHKTTTQPHVPHIKVRIGTWYTRHIGRWT